MNKITQSELNERIELHKKWLENEDGGKRLVIHGADLRRANLRVADLRWANLRGADLRWADLRVANLHGADLRGANLHGANLHGANIRWADLSEANLSEANIDYTSIDLACRHTGITMDIEQIRQLLYTVYMQECEDPEYAKIRSRIAPYVRRWSGLDRHGLRGKFDATLKKDPS